MQLGIEENWKWFIVGELGEEKEKEADYQQTNDPWCDWRCNFCYPISIDVKKWILQWNWFIFCIFNRQSLKKFYLFFIIVPTELLTDKQIIAIHVNYFEESNTELKKLYPLQIPSKIEHGIHDKMDKVNIRF
jgi:hypothetical protein